MENLKLEKFVSFSDEGKELLRKLNTYVVGCRRRSKYVDGKVVAGEYDGTTLTIQVDRGQEYANSTFDLIVPQLLESENVLDRDVDVYVDEAKVYAVTYKNSTYAQIKVSLHGHVEFVRDDNDGNDSNSENEKDVRNRDFFKR